MVNFVLVPGAWLGAWAWDEVAALLRASGHEVHALTLSGLAERAGPDAASVGLADHVDDIVSAIETAELQDVVLAGHSYAGVPVGQAAGHLGDRLRRVVYVDSSIPVAGRAFADGWAPEDQAWLADRFAETGGFWPPLVAENYAGHDLTDETIATLVARSTPHPGRAIKEPATLARPLDDFPSTYVKCLLDAPEPSPEVRELLTSPNWELVTLNTGHWPMFSRPTELAKLLADLAS